MSRFLSEKYQELVPYTPGEQPKNMERLIKLNTNENPYPPAPKVTEIMNCSEAERLRLYSDPTAAVLVNSIAEYYGISSDEVAVGNGSDEILAFVFMSFQGKTGKIYYPEISYSFYRVYCQVFGAVGVEIPLRENFSINIEDYYHKDGTIVITNPNAPTGIALTREEIRKILESNRENLVVIDEAYVDFGGESCVELIEEYDNLLVVQTFSKSRSLAGARIGFAMGNREIIADLNRIKFSFNPYNINRISILAGAEAMKDREYFNRCCADIIKTRENFTENMQSMGFEVLPSKANFVFVRPPSISGYEYFTRLREHGIIVRHFTADRIKDFVRITIGRREDMEQLTRATGDILK